MATLRQMLKWWLSDYVYAAVWQVRGTLRPGRPAALLSGDGRPVLILPGVWEPWGFMRPVIDAVHAAGHPVHVLPVLGRNSRPVPETAQAVASFLAEQDLRDVVIVAHSKGGLIGKYVMTELDPDARVTGMVAICTPFAGSHYARYMTLASLRAFSPDDPTTLRLQEQLHANTRITAVSGMFDPHIPTIAELPGATNVVLAEGGHFRLLGRPEVLSIVVDVTGRPRDDAPPAGA